jgi:hypothetical protein
VKLLDATELLSIVGHECELERAGVRCDEEIVRAYHCSTCLERSADLGIVQGRFTGKVQHFDVPQILIEGSVILLSPGRHLNSKQ